MCINNNNNKNDNEKKIIDINLYIINDKYGSLNYNKRW